MVSLRQLRELGLAASTVRGRVAAGRLHRLHRGVFAVGRREVSRRGRWLAAVLACGAGALLSHRSALELRGALPESPRWPDVTVPRTYQRRPGIRLHSSSALVTEDRTAVDGIPCTSVARSLVDFAERARPRELARAVEELERLRLFDGRTVQRAVWRANGRRGVAALTDALAAWSEPAFTRSGAERRVLELIADAGLPRPAVNTWVAGHEVDLHWPEQRVAVEVDSYAFHHTHQAFERDHERDAALDEADIRVLRITWRQLAERPAGGHQVRPG